jgi:hypothetical protein
MNVGCTRVVGNMMCEKQKVYNNHVLGTEK